MSMKSVDLWVCDRCAQDSEQSRNEQPGGWAAVYVVTPPLMNPMEGKGKSTTLCLACRRALISFLEPLAHEHPVEVPS